MNTCAASACIRTLIMYKCSEFGIVRNLLKVVNQNKVKDDTETTSSLTLRESVHESECLIFSTS